MFSREIIQIINKYQNENEINIKNINNAINTIIAELKIINSNLANQLRELAVDDNIDNDAENLLKDTVILREYINSITSLKFGEENLHETNEEFIESPSKFDKFVTLYLAPDDLCPFCNVKLHPHVIYYQRIIDNQVVNESIKWFTCPNCRRLIVIDIDAENFHFDNTNIILKKDQYDCIPSIDIYSLFVLSNTINCSLNHRTKDLVAKIPTIDENGNFNYEEINASYCFDCMRFTVLKEDFNSIKGTVMCKVIDETTDLQSRGSTESDIDIEQKKSILFNYGYNVQTKKNLSEAQRHIILSSVIEASIMNRRDVINHINTLIERGSKIHSWQDATQKWKADKKFVSEYQTNSLPDIIFNNIILKYRKNISIDTSII